MAKGLEFPVVFIVGLEEGILPHTRSSDSAEELEEERRLLYVGITRAKNRVYLVRAFRRAVFGRSEPARPSRFLSDIPLSLVQGLPRESAYAKAVPLGSDRWRWPSSAERPGVSRGQAARRSVKEPEFHTGDRVKHPKFGEGTVVDSKTVDGDELVTVEFAGQVKKKLLQTFANLEKVR
jgi:DNA helicase-2/ATP-dependent DNA helicase PcrA